MIFDYSKISKQIGMDLYNPDLDGKLIGIAQEYDRRVANNNKKIFTGKLAVGKRTISYPQTLKERLKAQRYATSAKIKVIEKYKGLYSPEEIISAIKGFKP